MLRLLMWGMIFYFVYKVIRSITVVRYTGQPPMQPPYTPPSQQGRPSGPDGARNSPPNSPNATLGSIQDAEFEELPPDPPTT